MSERGFHVMARPVESLDEVEKYDGILAAHVLEHVKDPAKVLAAFFMALKMGGTLYLVLPDDSDLCNPDHCWFFTADSLRKMVRDAGFFIDAVEVRKHVEKESFIYVRARRLNPAPFPVAYPPLLGHSWLYRAELDKIISLVGVRHRVLEIGSADGVTAGRIARERSEAIIVSVDPYWYHPEANGFPSSQTRLEYWRANAIGNQKLWMGTAAGFYEFCEEQFDLVIVDAVHTFTDTLADLQMAGLFSKGDGIIVAHDYDPAAFPPVAKAVDRFCEVSGWRVDEVVMTLAVLRREVI